MFLHLVGHNQRFRVIHQNWRRSVETVHRYFKEVLYAIGELRHDLIKPPSNETPLKVRNSHRWYPYFKDCVGAIDGTHVYARVPAKMQATFRGRKNYPTQNLISSGVRTDKGFKEVHLNQVAKAMQEFSGNEITDTQVYNHLRKWRQRWVRVVKLRELSGALWNEDTCAITLEDEHYKGHVKMQIIFANGQATGKFAMGSSEPLGSLSDFADSNLNYVDSDVGMAAGGSAEQTKTQQAATGTTGVVVGGGSGPQSDANNKRKRCILSDGDIVVLTGMTYAVNNVASASRETKVEDSHPALYDAVMFMPGFTDKALLAAYSHLLDNKAHGSAFVKMNDSHRVLWLKSYLAKHYYM
ncbi:hypothetical protein PVAP13_9NG205000 [Panicum virgatum]|uniref:Transposase n=1 Tax=Panicum virgatum TaxID=38727 RepID=A0A8T0MGY3_PANVG|nr:hypothetical protein PVAP13_9NG205000 [Panicum virgatum]